MVWMTKCILSQAVFVIWTLMLFNWRMKNRYFRSKTDCKECRSTYRLLYFGMGLSALDVRVPASEMVLLMFMEEKAQSQAHGWFSFTDVITASPQHPEGWHPLEKAAMGSVGWADSVEHKHILDGLICRACVPLVLNGSQKRLKTFWAGPHCLVHQSLRYYSQDCNNNKIPS